MELNLGITKPYKVYGEGIEWGAIEQFKSAMEQDYVVRGALLPDAHQGYSLPIGGVVACEGVVVPAYVGFDIGCGVSSVKVDVDITTLKKEASNIFNKINQDIPLGFKHHEFEAGDHNLNTISHTDVVKGLIKDGAYKQVGTLGSGNHFIEIGVDQAGSVYVTVHSGSRNLGHSVASHYMKLASTSNNAKEGHYPFYANSQNGMDYFKDMLFCMEFAAENRLNILDKVIRIINHYCGAKSVLRSYTDTCHNYIEKHENLYIHRKGVTPAYTNMEGLIPGNMRDGVFVTKGLGCKDSLFSSSHGAGRAMGRSKAKEKLSMTTFEEQMNNIISKVSLGTLDESPDAYKNIYDVMQYQEDLVEIINHIKPIINVKS